MSDLFEPLKLMYIYEDRERRSMVSCQKSQDFFQLPLCGHLQNNMENSRKESKVTSSLQQETFRMHLRCGSFEHAEKMLEEMCPRNAVLWTLLISALIQEERCQDAIRIFQKMQLKGDKPDRVAFITVLGAYAGIRNLAEAKFIHSRIHECGFEADLVVGTALVNMYGKCQSIENARLMFDWIPQKSVVAWNALITAYTQNGYLEYHCQEVIRVFRSMCLEGVKANQVTFVAVLNACIGPASQEGELILRQIIERGFELNVIVQTALIKMYGKAGCLENARGIFERMNERDVVSWNTMIAAYEQAGHCMEAMRVFWHMQLEKEAPNKITFITILNTCAGLGNLKQGRLVHALVVESALGGDEVLGASLVDMYLKCGSRSEAREILNQMRFRSVILWNAVITVCSQEGEFEEALRLFRQMQLEGVTPDGITFLGALSACVLLAEGKLIHACIAEIGLDSYAGVGAALVKMYGRFGVLEDAEEAFEAVLVKDLILWNAMVSVYAQLGHKDAAFRLYWQMQLLGMRPDSATFVNLLTLLPTLAEGVKIHSRILECNGESGIVMQNALLNMYSRCGSLEDALKVFTAMNERSQASWNSMIAAYSQHGHANRALQFFLEMQQEGVKPDATTLTSVLFACSHAGLAAEGSYYLMTMHADYGLTPSMEHYGCMIDLLARSGRVEESEDLLEQMPLKPDAAGWKALLAACRSSRDVERGQSAATRILEVDSGSSAAYMLLAESSKLSACFGIQNDQCRKRNPSCIYEI